MRSIMKLIFRKTLLLSLLLTVLGISFSTMAITASAPSIPTTKTLTDCLNQVGQNQPDVLAGCKSRCNLATVTEQQCTEICKQRIQQCNDHYTSSGSRP